MTLTAIRPDVGRAKGRETSLLKVSHASWLISALSVVLRALYGSPAPRKYACRTKKLSLVVVGVDEPASDALGAVAPDLARVRVEDVDAVDLDLELLGSFPVAPDREDVDVGLPEDDEEIPLAGVLEVVGHVQIGVHPGFQDGHASEPLELRCMRLVVERARDEDVEAPVGRLSGGGDEVGSCDGAEFRADEDGCPLLGCLIAAAFDVAALRAHEVPGPGADR